MRYDRDDVLARTDLVVLADEMLGQSKGRGPSARWRCPHPGHGQQSGRTPPVTLFTSPAGERRWRCHGCSAGGTAIDLVMVVRGVDFRDAIETLARRAGVAERDLGLTRPPPQRPLRPQTPAPPVEPSPELERYVAACEAALWSPQGTRMRRWLERRGLGLEVARANRLGADPGPRALPRAKGLPRAGPAVVLPVLGSDGRAVYLQARYLHPPGGRKYDNPSSALVGPSPRIAVVRSSDRLTRDDVAVVCEGIPDALVAAQAGYLAAAVLGAGLPDNRVAAALNDRFQSQRLVVCFDADDRGHAGAARIVELLRELDRHASTLEAPPGWGDLNDWRIGVGSRFADELGRAVEMAIDSHLRDDARPELTAGEAKVAERADGHYQPIVGNREAVSDRALGAPPSASRPPFRSPIPPRIDHGLAIEL